MERRSEFQFHSQQGQDFSVSPTADQLITQRSSVSRIVDLTSNGIVNHYLRDVDHGSTVLHVTGPHLSHHTERQRIRTVTKFSGSSPGHSGRSFVRLL